MPRLHSYLLRRFQGGGTCSRRPDQLSQALAGGLLAHCVGLPPINEPVAQLPAHWYL